MTIRLLVFTKVFNCDTKAVERNAVQDKITHRSITIVYLINVVGQ